MPNITLMHIQEIYKVNLNATFFYIGKNDERWFFAVLAAFDVL